MAIGMQSMNQTVNSVRSLPTGLSITCINRPVMKTAISPKLPITMTGCVARRKPTSSAVPIKTAKRKTASIGKTTFSNGPIRCCWTGLTGWLRETVRTCPEGRATQKSYQYALVGVVYHIFSWKCGADSERPRETGRCRSAGLFNAEPESTAWDLANGGGLLVVLRLKSLARNSDI